MTDSTSDPIDAVDWRNRRKSARAGSQKPRNPKPATD